MRMTTRIRIGAPAALRGNCSRLDIVAHLREEDCRFHRQPGLSASQPDAINAPNGFRSEGEVEQRCRPIRVFQLVGIGRNSPHRSYSTLIRANKYNTRDVSTLGQNSGDIVTCSEWPLPSLYPECCGQSTVAQAGAGCVTEARTRTLHLAKGSR